MKKRLSKTTGIRYIEHRTRKFAGRPERYFFIRLYIDGKEVEEGIGWESKGWTKNKVINLRNELSNNYKEGRRPFTFKERREMRRQKSDEANAAKKIKEAQRMTFDQFFENHFIPWKRDIRKATSWEVNVKVYKKRIKPAIGSLSLDAISQEILMNFMKGLYQEKLSDATVLHHMAIIRQVFRRAAITSINGTMAFKGSSPLSGIDLPKNLHDVNARTRYLTYEEATRLLTNAKKKAEEALSDLRYQAWMDLHDIILLALNTGLRAGEIKRLNWNDINFEQKMLTVRKDSRRKTGGTVPLNPVSFKMLDDRGFLFGITGRVFPPPHGGKQYDNFTVLFRKLVDSLGLNDDITDPRDKVVFHTLRHTFASWLAIEGVDIYRIQKLMRHKTHAMTSRYAHLRPEHTQDTVSKISDRLSSKRNKNKDTDENDDEDDPDLEPVL